MLDKLNKCMILYIKYILIKIYIYSFYKVENDIN